MKMKICVVGEMRKLTCHLQWKANWFGCTGVHDIIMHGVGQNHIYTVYRCTVFLAGKSPNIWSHTVDIYSFGQPYIRILSCQSV